MRCEKQERPASGIITEGPSRDQFGCSLNGVAHNLNDGTNLLKGPNHIASWSSKSDPDGSIHKNQVHAIPGFAFVVKNTEIDKHHTQLDMNVFFDSKCPKETSEQEHPRKAVLSTSSCSDVKCSANDMKDAQRSTQLEFSGSMITSAYKEDASCPSKNQSSVARSNGFSAKLSNYETPDKNSMEKKTETNCQNETLLNCTSASSGNDLKVRCTASEDVSANEKHFSCPSNGHSASSGTKSSPDRLMDGIIIDADNIRITEANHPKKPMPGSSPCTSPQSSEDMTTNQKKSDSMSNPLTNATVDEGPHARSSSTHSMSSLDPSCRDGIFLTVSDISLRTQPSHGPPPARPPPARPPSRFDLSGRNLRRTLTDYQKYDVGTGITYKSQSFKQAMRDGSPPPFDVEMDASSAAAASVAAIKEAMELAQARLKSAKVSRERKDNLQSRRKLGLNEDLSGINRDGHETVQENQRIREEVVVQLACEKTDGQKNGFAAEKMATALNPSLMAGDFKEKERNRGSAEVSLQAMHGGEPEVSRLSNIKQDKAGEWKVEEQFYEFIQSEKNLKKVPENSLKDDTETRSDTRIGIVGEELNASELKKSEKLLAASNVLEGEGDSTRLQNSVSGKEQIKESQEASLASTMPEYCNLRRKETIDAHHQEKQPGKFQELLKTEQETKWRTSEEAFICELSEKNLRVNNDAFQCKPVNGCQGQEKIQRGTDETSGCEETEKEINVADEYFECHEEDNIVQGKLSELDGNKMEANVIHVSNVFAKDVHPKTVSTNHEYENQRMSLNTDEHGCFPEGQEIEPKEASFFFGQDKGNISNLARRAFEWAANVNEQKTPLDIHDWKDNKENFNVLQGTNGCSDEANQLKEIQKFPMETEEELQVKFVKQNTSSTAGIKGVFGSDTAAAYEGCKKKINENIKDVQVVESNKFVKSAEIVCKGTENDNKIEDAQKASSLGEQWHTCKAPQESSGNRGAGLPVENDSHGHETGDINGHETGDINRDKMEIEQVSDSEEGKEREIRKLEEKEREIMKLEGEREKKRIELEEKEREKKLEEAKERERRRLKKEKEGQKRLEEEKERIRLEEERERERKKLEEEREKKRIEEERERMKLEEEREKKRLEEERERKKLEEEREKKRLEEEERKRKKIEDDEREKKRLEEDNERRKSEKEERERKKSEEAEERRKLEEERERRKVEEEERERRKMEEIERMRKKQEEEDRERSELEEKERERRKQEEERERRRLEDIERERRKLEEKVRERRRIEEAERERKLEEEKVKERQKIEEEKAREKNLDEEREKEWRKREEEKERDRKRLEEERDREREREKDRQAVERATQEAHERAFAEARERAERAAVERITAEARQRALAEARERAEKASAEALEKSMAEKASREARLRSERAAVERATAEARERAVEKAIAEKAAQDARERAEKLATTSREGVRQNFSNVRELDPQFQNAGTSSNSYQKYSDSLLNASFMNEKFGGSEGESAIRCKARMERHQRTVERAAKALAEKNLRDIIAQREQAERNRLAETLVADVKRWSNGKEGNLRALLSTLQYILGPESGWQPMPLTDVVTAPAVKKAYRKATLCVHPDKLQQRGASIQQKYICEKVFDLLKEAWNKFNSEER